MSTPETDRLRVYLKTLTPGPIEDKRSVVELLAECWDQLRGSDVEAMTSTKLRRIEAVEWDPPVLSFVIERHGATVMGSTRAELHRWTISLTSGTAVCNDHYSYRQVYDRDPPLFVKPIVAEIVQLIVQGQDDARLKWFPGREAVRVLVRGFIRGQFKQTQEGRRKRFRLALERALRSEGWEKVPGKLDLYRRPGSSGAGSGNSGVES